jgi:hypothetical protein
VTQGAPGGPDSRRRARPRTGGPYPNPNIGESSKLVSTSGTSIGIAVDEGRLTLSVESQIPHVSFRENFALLTDPIQGGIVEARDDGHTIPVFVFQIGGWSWNAPFTLGAETPDRCSQIATALREGRASNHEGWKIDFCLVDALTLSKTARRTLSERFPAATEPWADRPSVPHAPIRPPFL